MVFEQVGGEQKLADLVVIGIFFNYYSCLICREVLDFFPWLGQWLFLTGVSYAGLAIEAEMCN